MAAAAPPSWADLPADCLHEVFSRVPGLADRQNAFRACPRWLEALRACPALPSLLFPAPSRYDGCPRLVCALSGFGVLDDYPAVIRRGARCFGSHGGGSLFLAARDPHGHTLLNVRTGTALDLPGGMQLDLTWLSPSLGVLDLPMATAHAAALSAPPGEASCVALFVVREPRVRCVTRWRMGQQGDEEFYFLDAEQYTCSDNGRWSEPNGVQRCFPPADPSWNSRPAWVLP